MNSIKKSSSLALKEPLIKSLKVSRIPAFEDNYIWFIHGLPEKQAEKQIIIVDPGEAWPVLQSIKQNQYQPQAIFITHHHGDHTGGIREILARFDIPVYGPAHESIPTISHKLDETKTVSLNSMGLSFKVLDVPGHTLGHIAYLYRADNKDSSLFIGDTLFAGGCGRIFEGTAEQMHHSLDKLLQLDDNTWVYCAHEYTQENLVFAQRVEPENTVLLQRIKDTRELRSAGKATVPSLLKLEKQTNPFLRFNYQSVIKAAEQFAGKHLSTPAEVFSTVRYWKDTLD